MGEISLEYAIAIKKEKPNRLKDVDADDLQFFLTKTEGGAWLDGAEAAAVTLDGDATPARL
ncbi:Crinkler (CRN) family protein [Phytophthora palmivora]|uniref:Crinkler (CRN) family protein n=1 Tax=Phytophthora palmivora TaxID=4796 RepID=A0A2P4Y3X9_9STRA|nr:Crinkler (CRN) family protein [Phytophthora palmivora]